MMIVELLMSPPCVILDHIVMPLLSGYHGNVL